MSDHMNKQMLRHCNGGQIFQAEKPQPSNPIEIP
jgi:hypothetical protein